jgi:serine/threonine protein kinase/Flp pilus assembly protein TadD
MITPELWQRMIPLFEESISKPLHERAAFAQNACRDDPELLEQLKLLLNAHELSNIPIDNPIMYIEQLLSTGEPRFSDGETILGRFEIVRLVGSGGMGEVYEAIDLELGRVALKTIRPGIAGNPVMMSRFKHEVQVAREISGVHTCRIYELFVIPAEKGRPPAAFLTMEFLDGTTLSEVIKQNGLLQYREAESIALQVCKALDCIHKAGIVHRDLKTRNIMITGGDTNGRVVVMDFGLARHILRPGSVKTTWLQEGSGILGTPEYMAPEQFEDGEITPATDVYALGVVLYELVTGQLPFAGATAFATAVRRGKQPPLASSVQPGLPHRWDEVIGKCLQFDADRRFQSAAEVVAGLSSSRFRVSPLFHINGGNHTNRRYLYAMSAIIAILLVLAAGLWRYIGYRAASHPADKSVLMIGTFDNRTGDPVFDATLPEMFSATLEQSNNIAIYPRSRVEETLKSMGKPSDELIDEKTGLEICQRAGLNALLRGSISRLGTGYTLIVRVQRPSAEDILSLSRTVASANQIPAAVDSMAASLRRGLGESTSSLREHIIPLATVTSPSLDAIRFFTVGKEDLYTGDLDDAVQMLDKALELDRNFAMAHETLGVTYDHLREFELERKELHDAMLLSGRVSQPERLKILGVYYNAIMDYEKGCGYYKTLIELEPTDPMPFINLGLCRKNVFDFAGAETYTGKAVQMLPKSRVRLNLASQIFLGGDTERSLPMAETLSKEFPTDVVAQRIMGNIYLAAGRLEQAKKTYSRMVKVGGDAETVGHAGLADLALSTGQYREAKAELKLAILSAEKSGNRFAQENARITLAETLIMSGSREEAEEVLRQITPLKDFAVLSLLLGRTYARTHQWELARQNLVMLDHSVAESDTPPLKSMRLLLQAEVALSQHNFSAAIDLASKANVYYPSSFAAETLARCYDDADNKEEAIKQYQIVLDRGNERTDSFDAPAFNRIVYARYRLGVLLQEHGRPDAARDQLLRFRSYWSHPDADLKIAKDVQRRLLQLEKGEPTAAM